MKKSKILVLENNFSDYQDIVKLLFPFGYAATNFFQINQLEQIHDEAALAFDPDLIFATFEQSDSNGFVHSYMQVQHEFPSVPVIILANINDDELAVKCIQSGAQSFLVKGSFNGQRLERLIAFSLERNNFRSELNRLKRDYQNIFEKNGVPMLLADKNTLQIISVNESAVSLYGYEFDEFCKLSLRDLGNKPKDSDDYIEQTILGNPQFVCHYKKDGEPMYVEMKESSVFYNNTSSLLVAINNVTARVVSANEEHKARQRLNAIFNGTYDIILLTNDEGKLVQVNKAACLLLGYAEEEMLKLLVSDITLPTSENAVENTDQWSSFLFAGSQSGFTELKKKNGRKIICTYNATTSILPGLHLCILTDVTIHEKNRRKIEQQSKRIDNILNSISECFFTVDKNWAITYWNKAAEKLVLVKKEDLIGKSMWDCFAPAKDLLFYTNYQKAMNEHVAVHFEEYYAQLDIWVTASCYPTKEGLAIFFKDITAQKKFSLQLQEVRNNQFALINSTSNLIWSIDSDMRLLSFNNAYAQRILEANGKLATEGMQLPSSFHSPQQYKVWKSYYERALKGETYSILETIVDEKNKRIKKAEITFNPFLEVNTNKIKGVACYSHDITMREIQNERLKANEKNLEKLSAKLEKIMNSSLDVICSIDGRGRFLQVSMASIYVWGYYPEELIGKFALSYVAPQFYETSKKAAFKLVAGAVYTDFQNVIVHKNGHLVPVTWSARWDREDQIMFCVARDASALKETEKLKAENEQRINALMQNGADIIGILDESANYLYISPNVKALLGYEPESLLKTNATDLIHPEDVSTSLQELKKVLTDGEVKLAAFRYKNAVGEWRWIETVATNMLQNPAIKGIVISSRDITTRKQIEAEREQMIKELLKSNADLKQFSFITSHNLRAPLSNIVGILNMIEYGLLDDYNKNMLDMLGKSVHQLGQTIDDLSKILIVKNNVNVDIADIELTTTFKKVNSVFVNTLNDVSAIVKTDFKVSHIPFNPTYFESILVNLISNSIKYRSPNRDLSIHVSSHTEAVGNIVLKFADNGIGIDLNRHENKLFGLYQRFHDHIEGHGLGLFIIKSQIVALGGKIDVQSEVDKGTTFSITFKGR